MAWIQIVFQHAQWEETIDASGCCVETLMVSLGYQSYPLLIFAGSLESAYSPFEVCVTVIKTAMTNNETFMQISVWYTSNLIGEWPQQIRTLVSALASTLTSTIVSTWHKHLHQAWYHLDIYLASTIALPWYLGINLCMKISFVLVLTLVSASVQSWQWIGVTASQNLIVPMLEYWLPLITSFVCWYKERFERTGDHRFTITARRASKWNSFTLRVSLTFQKHLGK